MKLTYVALDLKYVIIVFSVTVFHCMLYFYNYSFPCVCVIELVLYSVKHFGNPMKMVRVLYFLLDKNTCIKR